MSDSPSSLLSLPVLGGLFICSVIVAWFALKFVFGGGAWESVEGTIVSSEFTTEHHKVSSKGERSRALSYHYSVAYDYSVEGRTYRGNRVFPLLPTIFSRKDMAEAMREKFPTGAKVPVAFRAAEPGNSCLIPGTVPGAKVHLLVAVIAGIALTAIVAVALWSRTLS